MFLPVGIYGFVVIFELIACVILVVVGMFLQNVLLFDSIALGIFASAFVTSQFQIHPALALLIGIATLILFQILSRTSIGFWLISIAVSVFLAFIIAAIVWSSTGKDPIWSRVSWGIAFAVIMGLHIKARD